MKARLGGDGDRGSGIGSRERVVCGLCFYVTGFRFELIEWRGGVGCVESMIMGFWGIMHWF